MKPIVVTRQSAFSPTELFQVAADIEAYPQFLPNFIAARRHKQSEDEWLVDNVLRWWGVTMNVQTIATFDPPYAIDIRAIKTFGMNFAIHWRFDQVAGGTLVTFELALTLPGKTLDALARRTVAHQAEAIADAFIQRTAAMAAHSSIANRPDGR